MVFLRNYNSFLFSFVLSLTVGLVISCARATAFDGYSTVSRVVELFSVWTDDKLDKSIQSELNDYIDFAEMAERALGSNWSKLDSARRQEFVAVFKKLVENKYYRRWRKVLSKGKLSKVSQVETKDSLYVKTKLTDDDDVDYLVFRLSKRSTKLKIISIAVGDKDLLTRISARVNKYAQKKGLDQLFEWMVDKAD